MDKITLPVTDRLIDYLDAAVRGSSTDFCRTAGIARSTLFRIIRGATHTVNDETARALAKALAITPRRLRAIALGLDDDAVSLAEAIDRMPDHERVAVEALLKPYLRGE